MQTDLDRLGIDEAISNLSRAEKVLLIYLSLERQLINSQGDLAKTINSTANQQKIFAEQSARLSRVLGNILNPTAGKLLQVLNGVSMVIVELVEMFAKLVGFELPTYETGTDLDWVEDLDTGLGSANDKAKELKKSLRGFDKLNVINTPSSSSNIGGGIGSGAGVMDELLSHLNEYDLQMQNMENNATKIRDRIMEWLGFTKEVNAETGEIIWKYNKANENLKDIAERLGGTLAEQLNSVTDDIEWEKIGENIAKGLNTSFVFVNTFVEEYKWNNLGEGFAKSLNNAIDELDAEELGKFLTNKFKIMVESAEGFFEEFDWHDLGVLIGETISAEIENIDIPAIARVMSQLFEGLGETLVTAILNIDWKDVLGDLVEGFEELNTPLKTLVGLGVAKVILNISDSVGKLSKTLKKDNLGKVISDSYDSFKKLLDMQKQYGLTANKELGISTRDVWSASLTSGEKFRNLLVGAGGILVSLSLVSDGLNDIEENGVNLFNVLETGFGAVSALLSGWVTGGWIGLAVSGIGLIVQAVQELTGETEEGTSKAEQYKQKLKEMYSDAEANARSNEYILDTTSKLTDELGTLIDATGKVKEGEEDRAEVILTQLNEALGTEYELNGNLIEVNGEVVDSYEDIKKEIEEVIKAKRKQNLLDAYSTVHQENLRKIGELYTKQQKIEEQLSKDRKAGNELEIKMGEKALELNKKAIDQYQEQINAYDYASAVISSGIDENSEEYKKAIQMLKDNNYEFIGETLENVSKVTQSTDENTQKQQTFWGRIVDKVKDVNKNVEELSGKNATVNVDINKEKFDKDISSIKKQNIVLDTLLKFKTDDSNVSNAVSKIVNSFTKALPNTFKKFLGISGYAEGGFPEDGWFRASKGELMGSFDDGTSMVANNRQVVAGVREMLKDGMMDALMMANNTNKQNVNVTIVAEDNDMLNGIKFKEKQRDRQYGF